MGAAMRDAGKDRVAWVPRCPSCGERMGNPKLIAGTDPPEAPRLKRLAKMGWPCRACGTVVDVEDVERWARVDEVGETDEADPLVDA